jgi:Fe-S-cluster containining protein
MNIDEWFAGIRAKYTSQMQCGKGCTACCHGLFDISLADAVEVARGFQELPPDVQLHLARRAADLYAVIRRSAPDKGTPVLFAEDDARIDAAVDAANEPPCPLLGGKGECLIYEHRPMACRLEGVPMIDVHDGLFGDWCELNFTQGIPKSAKTDLQQDYEAIDTEQDRRSSDCARRAGLPNARAVTFIPSVISEYRSFWSALVSRNCDIAGAHRPPLQQT